MKLNRRRDAQRSDVAGIVARFALFFDEPTVPTGAEKVLIMLTDGQDNGPWKKDSSIRLPQDVTVFTVGIRPDLARTLFGDRVAIFEGIDPAVQSLGSTKLKAR